MAAASGGTHFGVTLPQIKRTWEEARETALEIDRRQETPRRLDRGVALGVEELVVACDLVRVALAFRRFLQRGALGIADAVPFILGQNDAAIHVQPVDFEGGVECMQQGGVIGIAHILGI